MVSLPLYPRSRQRRRSRTLAYWHRGVRRVLHWWQSKNTHKSRKDKLGRVPGTQRFDHKKTVLGALQPNGDVRLEVCTVKQPTRKLHEFIKAKLADETELIATDENNQYEGVADGNTRHETVSHTQKEWVRGIVHTNEEWVRGIVHTNGLEGVWSLFKRSIVGSYHQNLCQTSGSLLRRI